MPGYVFISYSRQDRPYVDRLAAYIRRAGVPVWYDYDMVAGDRFATVIQGEIDDCAAFIAVLTPSAKASEWVEREITHAVNRGKVILPMLLEDSDHILLGNRQHEDVRGQVMPSPQFVDRLRAMVVATQENPLSLQRTPPASETRRESSGPAVVVRRVLTGHTANINSIRYSPDGARPATAASDWTARLWDSMTGMCLHVLDGHNGAVESLSWSPTGDRVATVSGASPTDTSAGTRPHDQSVFVWDATTGRLLHTLVDRPRGLWFAAWSPDGEHVLTINRLQEILIWNREGRLVRTVGGAHNRAQYAEWSPDGKYLATFVAGSAEVTVWDASTADRAHVLTGHLRLINQMSWAKNSLVLATVSEDDTTRIWNAETGACVRIIYSRPWGEKIGPKVYAWLGFDTYSTAWSPGDTLLATASTANDFADLMRVWNPKTGECLRTLSVGRMYWSLGWSSRGQHLVSAAGSQAQIWDVAGNEVIHTIALQNSEHVELDVSPSSDMLAATTNDNTVTIWEIANQSPSHVDYSLTSDGRTVRSDVVEFFKTGRLGGPVIGIVVVIVVLILFLAFRA
jgi:WD40 repeat protein